LVRFSGVARGVSILRLAILLAIPFTGVAQQSAVPRSREVNDAGRFFAGLPAETGSAFARFEAGAAWKNIDGGWTWLGPKLKPD